MHGYTGSPQDLAPLAHALSHQFGADAVCTVHLPGHAQDLPPVFDPDLFERAISEAVNAHCIHGRQPVLLGHSTGGSLALGYLLSSKQFPAMLILAGTPVRVDGEDLARWEQHRRHQKSVALIDVARMVSYINRLGRTTQEQPFPVLVLSGSDDTLVSAARAERWRNGPFQGPVRKVTLPGATHDLFTGPLGSIAIDCVARGLSDLASPPTPAEVKTADVIGEIETGVSGFVDARPARLSHLVRSPAALRVLGQPIHYSAIAQTDPIQLNIEITSRCNLTCDHCARSFHKRSGSDMTLDAFEYLLDLMPSTYKVVLVGLGEPTLHPRLVDFVNLATSRGLKVGMVTNAMAMDKELSRRLIAAGLHSLTYSLDSVDIELASRVRRGTDLDLIRSNIEAFQTLANGKIPTAVFSAVSTHTVNHLPELANAVARIGVTAWMLSDMNFHSNLAASLWKSWHRGYREPIGRALHVAFSHNVPVLSVRGLEEIGLQVRYHNYLITSPAEIGRRSADHQWCLSPWQTLPIDVDGNVTLCDCQPHAVVGNLFEQPFSEIWNGRAMQAQRRLMRSEAPPEDCRICPRF